MTSTLCSALMIALCLLTTPWVVVHSQQAKTLKTRDSDGAPVCARDEPSRRAMTSAKMSGAPAVVGCSMTCTADYQCRHFNYVPTDRLYPCHLYYNRPTRFEVQADCLHYETPGKRKQYFGEFGNTECVINTIGTQDERCGYK